MSKMNEEQFIRDLADEKINIDKHKDRFTQYQKNYHSVDYPVQSNMRWDDMPSDNNEDLFRGILWDYSALNNTWDDCIGQGIMFGVGIDMDDSNSIVQTAAFRGVYRKDGNHEAHIVVGRNQLGSFKKDDHNERHVYEVVNINAKRVKINASLVLHAVREGNGLDDPETGSLAYTYQGKGPPSLVFYNGEKWMKVQLGDIEHEE